MCKQNVLPLDQHFLILSPSFIRSFNHFLYLSHHLGVVFYVSMASHIQGTQFLPFEANMGGKTGVERITVQYWGTKTSEKVRGEHRNLKWQGDIRGVLPEMTGERYWHWDPKNRSKHPAPCRQGHGESNTEKTLYKVPLRGHRQTLCYTRRSSSRAQLRDTPRMINTRPPVHRSHWELDLSAFHKVKCVGWIITNWLDLVIL